MIQICYTYNILRTFSLIVWSIFVSIFSIFSCIDIFDFFVEKIGYISDIYQWYISMIYIMPTLLVTLTFDLLTLKETGMLVASKVENFPSKFRHARPLGSRIIRYVRDGWTDRQTDGQSNAYCPLPYGHTFSQREFLTGEETYGTAAPPRWQTNEQTDKQRNRCQHHRVKPSLCGWDYVGFDITSYDLWFTLTVKCRARVDAISLGGVNLSVQSASQAQTRLECAIGPISRSRIVVCMQPTCTHEHMIIIAQCTWYLSIFSVACSSASSTSAVMTFFGSRGLYLQRKHHGLQRTLTKLALNWVNASWRHRCFGETNTKLSLAVAEKPRVAACIRCWKYLS